MNKVLVILLISIALYTTTAYSSLPNLEIRKYMRKGISYEKEHEYTSAISAYTKVLTISENYIPAYYGRGLAYMEIGSYKLALEDFNVYITQNPNNLKVVYLIGLCNYHIKNYKDALLGFNYVLDKKTKSYNKVYNIRGLTNYYLANYIKAIEDFTNYLALNPKYSYAYLYRGRAYNKLNEKKEAIRNYKAYTTLTRNYRSRRSIKNEITVLEEEARVEANEEANKEAEAKEAVLPARAEEEPTATTELLDKENNKAESSKIEASKKVTKDANKELDKEDEQSDKAK